MASLLFAPPHECCTRYIYLSASSSISRLASSQSNRIQNYQWMLCAVSSVVERSIAARRVSGSNPELRYDCHNLFCFCFIPPRRGGRKKRNHKPTYICQIGPQKSTYLPFFLFSFFFKKVFIAFLRVSRHGEPRNSEKPFLEIFWS